ncbi:Os06g0725150, partial [Oryza sativa Japonica Group]
VHAVPEHEPVAVAAQRRAALAGPLRAQPPAAAARAVGVRVAGGARVGEGQLRERVRVGDGVGEPRQPRGEAGHVAAERRVEAGGELVHAVVAAARRVRHAHARHAPHRPNVDDPKLPRAHPVQLLHTYTNTIHQLAIS